MKRFIAMLLAMLLFITPALAASDEKEYNNAWQLLQEGKFTQAAAAFGSLGYYSDSSLMAMYCSALAAGESGQYATAATNFSALGSFRDSALFSRYYTARWYESNQEYEKAAEILSGMTFFQDSTARLLSYPDLIARRDADIQEARNAETYRIAEENEASGNLEEAVIGFRKLGSYRDSAERANALEAMISERDHAAAYAAAAKAEQDGDFATAYRGFTALNGYLDSTERALAIREKGLYAIGMQHILAGDYNSAYARFTLLGDYSDSAEKAYLLGVVTFADTVVQVDKRIAAFRYRSSWGLINLDTNTLIAPCWDAIDPFNNLGLAVVKKDGLYGYIDTQGNVVIPAAWYAVSSFSGNLCVVASRETAYSSSSSTSYRYFFGIYDASGRCITEPQWRTLGNSGNSHWPSSKYDNNQLLCNAPVFDDNRILVQTRDGLWSFINQDGQLIGSNFWATIGSFSEDLTFVQDTNGLIGFIDQDGNVVIEPQYTGVHSFTEGLAAVKKNGYWQYIDKENNVVISASYLQAGSFTNGWAEVYQEGFGWQIIDNSGALVYFVTNDVRSRYDNAVALMEAGSFDEARAEFLKIPTYRDAAARADECLVLKDEAAYQKALSHMTQGEYVTAGNIFFLLGNYKDAQSLFEMCRQKAEPGSFSYYTVESKGEYGFALDSESGYYVSQNKGVPASTAACTVTVLSHTGYVYIDVINFSQPNQDYGTIYKPDSRQEVIESFKPTSMHKSDVQTVKIELPDNEEHTIYITYRKNRDKNQNYDTFQFKLRFN